ncbi:hypothetical protein R3J22_06145 [Trueperella bernardiae]|uniref:hypothetical protein n=1 Tax=Trueperella bernardiae TaxID=59561 RepID=UPI0029494EA6|nr:hypothetical protein [Trueperella bernardiae]MDV6239107.1 hypothetical protein [Trueperella bernardiae]
MTEKKTTTVKKQAEQKVERGEMFTYTTANGALTLPYLEDVPMRLLEDHATEPMAAFLAAVLEEYLDEDANQTRREMPIKSFNQMMEEWVAASELNLGESEA